VLDYSCTGEPTTLTNTATVSWSTQTLASKAVLGGGSKSFEKTFTLPGTDIDECVNVTDTYAGDLGKVCVGDANPKTFTYDRTVKFDEGQLGKCVKYDNTATFTTNDTGATNSDSESVTVCFKYDALTIGYWGTHLGNDGKKGGTNECNGLKLPGGTGCSSNAPWASAKLPQSLGGFSVTTALSVAQVIAANNCSSTKDQDAVACLAAQLLAAKLNVATFGSHPCIDAIISSADTFLGSVNYTGPAGKYTLSATQRAQAIALKTQLDNYNNQKGC
jgi:hypothetical protein